METCSEISDSSRSFPPSNPVSPIMVALRDFAYSTAAMTFGEFPEAEWPPANRPAHVDQLIDEHFFVAFVVRECRHYRDVICQTMARNGFTSPVRVPTEMSFAKCEAVAADPPLPIKKRRFRFVGPKAANRQMHRRRHNPPKRNSWRDNQGTPSISGCIAGLGHFVYFVHENKISRARSAGCPNRDRLRQEC